MRKICALLIIFLSIFCTTCFGLFVDVSAMALEPNFTANTPYNRYQLNASNNYTVVFSNYSYDRNRSSASAYQYYFTTNALGFNLDLTVFPRAAENTADTILTITDAHITGSGITAQVICKMKRKKNNGVVISKIDEATQQNGNNEWVADPGSFWPYSPDYSEHSVVIKANGNVIARITFKNGTDPEPYAA